MKCLMIAAVGGLLAGISSQAVANPLKESPNQPGRQVLWYDSPANNWETEALPIGNGRLDAMIFGGVEKEHYQFNEDSLWEGDEKDTGSYQNFGDVEVTLAKGADVRNYRRELDISRAVHTVRKSSERREKNEKTS